jgi:hypothetical protein
LITGDKNGDLEKYICLYTSGDEAEKRGQVLYKRLGATHAIERDKQLDLLNNKKKCLKG